MKELDPAQVSAAYPCWDTDSSLGVGAMEAEELRAKTMDNCEVSKCYYASTNCKSALPLMFV